MPFFNSFGNHLRQYMYIALVFPLLSKKFIS